MLHRLETRQDNKYYHKHHSNHNSDAHISGSLWIDESYLKDPKKNSINKQLKLLSRISHSTNLVRTKIRNSMTLETKYFTIISSKLR